MKTILKYSQPFLLFSMLLLANACGLLPNSAKKDMKKNYVYYNQFNPDQLQIIDTHWRQYFTRNIIPDISDLKSSDYHPIFLDNYGCIYPENEIYSDTFEFKKDRKKNILKDGSHYANFYKDSSFRKDILNLGFDTSLISKIKNNWDGLLSSNSNFVKITHFNQVWNNLFLPSTIDSLRQKLNTKSKVVFFIHGYNVPYSLAAIQFLSLRKQLIYQGLDGDNTLFVPVYWPSNDMKHSTFYPLCRFNVSDFIGVKNLKSWLTYSNQAYYASLTFRRILCELESTFHNQNCEVMIVAHSLGATVATSSLIKTYSKFKIEDGEIIKENFYDVDLSNRFENEPISNYPMKIFLSAPAIPGYNTFIDVDTNFSNKIVFSTYNKKDRMVSKFHLLARKLGSTSLGGNFRDEAQVVKQFFILKKDFGDFYYKETSKRRDHDIFTYMRQPEYQKFLKKFLKTPSN